MSEKAKAADLQMNVIPHSSRIVLYMDSQSSLKPLK